VTRYWFGIICGGIALLTSDGVEGALVEYTIRFSQAKNHYADVELRCETGGQQQFELMMPTWTPGSYLIREYARHVETISASDSDGAELSISRSRKNRWLVKCSNAKSVVVKYRLYCNEMTVRTNQVESEFALFNGASTFLSPVGSRQKKHQVRIELPDEWKHAICSLPNVDGDKQLFIADDFDELVDSPILCGNPNIYPFKVGDREHLLVSIGEGEIWDGDATARDLEKIVAEHHRLWGVVPYPRYIFFNLLVESGGGLEHDNSTVMMISRWYYRDREKYVRWLGLASHEFFHTWNVRRLRPKPLVEYDYENEVYLRSLWIAEGITSYYDDLQLARCGLISQTEYLKAVSKQIETLQTTPGRNIQSLSDSSHDTWIKLYRPNENSGNSQVSYYNKGAVAAFLLDAEIRSATDGKKSLDDVMRILYERHVGNVGYSPDDFRAIVAEVSGTDLTAWFARYIEGVEEFDYSKSLELYGLQFQTPKATKPEGEADDSKPDEAAKTPAPKKKAWVGLTTEDSSGRLVVAKVLRDSPAFQAGLNPDDEILAIDDYRVTANQFADRLKQYQPGDSVGVLIARRQRLSTLRLVLGEEPAKTWKLSVVEKPTDDQKQRLAGWLHQK
jgi:predicted metalloprotease with PDZ domain